MEVAALSKHRFGMFLEVFRFVYDLLGMHLSLRKAYCETFLEKTRQEHAEHSLLDQLDIRETLGALPHSPRCLLAAVLAPLRLRQVVGPAW